MATVAGAVSAGLGDKVGTLTAGKEADIILLNARALNTWPLNNAPGSAVTMMDTSNVDTVFIGGRLKKWRGKLVGRPREPAPGRDRGGARPRADPDPVGADPNRRPQFRAGIYAEAAGFLLLGRPAQQSAGMRRGPNPRSD
jgi:hypothetical protein